MQKLLPIFLLLLAGCMDDDDFVEVTEHELTIAFRAEYGGEPLQIQADSYAYPTGDSLKMLLFQYYLSDLSLGVQGPGSHFVINDIDLIRWNSAVDSAEVERTYTFRAPEGQFNGLHFELGVKPELNATDPSNFSADYVLNENEFWGPQTRYVFAKIEANAMLEEDGRFDTGLTYHMGSDSLYRSINLPQAFTLEPGRNSRLTIVVDIRDALSSNGETLDITDPAKQTVHGGNQAVANGVWDRLAGSFRLEVQ